jgi:cyclophilin family peptidyl-prolyl cis-trans isomerase
MGRAEKLKEQRKIERVRKQLNKERKFRKFGLVTLGVLAGMGVGAGVYFGAQFVKDKYFEKEEVVVESTDIKRKYDVAPEMVIDTAKSYVAKFETSQGDFAVDLYTKDAPKTVNNFVFLARNRFYDGLSFHRVINDFMIQGGDPNGDGTRDPGYKFDDEFNSHKLVRGTLAMANSGANTNGSQFFIVTKEATEWLDGKHTAFGNVTSGLENVMKIQTVPVGENDKPTEAVIINKVTIEEK